MKDDTVKEYRYKNAVIRITVPTEEQKQNIRKATEVFLKKIVNTNSYNFNKSP